MENLKTIEPIAFNGLENLEILEVKNNPKLDYIDPKAFYNSLDDEFPNTVENVDLSNNALRTLSKSLLNWNKTNVILVGNQWNCNCHLSWILDLDLDEFVICSSPENLKSKVISTLKEEDFQCKGNVTLLPSRQMR